MSIRSLFVITSLERGGSEGQLTELLARIHPEAVDATLAMVVPPRDERHVAKLRGCGVPQVVIGTGEGALPRRSATAVLGLAGVIRRVRPHVVYAWGELPSVLAVPIARLHRIPVAVARRNSGNANLRPAVVRAARLAQAHARLVTVNSEAALDESARRGVPRHRLRLVHNGHQAGTSAPPPPGDEVRLGYVAGLRPGKGHDQLLRALPEVHASARWSVELAGDGPLLDELCTEVHERGLAERVRFRGTVDDIAGFWRDHHACLLLSDSEGASNALIEAGLAGRPLLATDVPGNRDVVTPDAGILVRHGDACDTARGLGRIIDDARLRERLGRGASETMRRRFDVDGMVAGHLAVLEECVGGGA